MPHDRPGTLSFQTGCFVVAEFLLTSASRGPSAIAEPRFFIIWQQYKQEAFVKCWAHSPLRAAARPNFTLPFTRCRYCRTPPAHRCPRRRRRQRQRVTEGTAMAPWNGPNNVIISHIQ